MKEITKKYPKEDVEIIWQPHKCIHSAICIGGLPSVFNNRVRPWVRPEAADKKIIIEQVNNCPSGALSIKSKFNQNTVETNNTLKVEVMKQGPLIIKGGCMVVDKDGNEIVKEGAVAFCRCGHSKNKPYCDGAHRSNAFEE